MKQCPTCHRTFTDETLSYCLDDGSPLLDASGSGPQSYNSNLNIKPPQSLGAAPAPTIAYRPGATAANQGATAWPAGGPPRKRKVWPWVLGGVGLLFLLGIGFIVLIIALASVASNTNTANANSSNNRTNNKSNSNSTNSSNRQSLSNANATNSSDSSNSNTSSSGTSDVEIKELNMARDDGKGGIGETVESFSPSDRTVHCVVHLNEIKAGTKVKFSWYAVDVGGDKNKLIKELEYTTGSLENIVHAHLTFPQDWPTGDYRVDVSLNDGPTRSIEYSVE